MEYAEGDDQGGVKIVTTDTTGKTGRGGCSFDATTGARPRVDAASASDFCTSPSSSAKTIPANGGSLNGSAKVAHHYVDKVGRVGILMQWGIIGLKDVKYPLN